MGQIMVRYKVKPECSAENEALARKVYDELQQVAPPGLRYATFALEDGVSFVHLASHDGDGESPLAGVPAFRAFLENIDARCEEPPHQFDLRPIGAYGLIPS